MSFVSLRGRFCLPLLAAVVTMGAVVGASSARAESSAPGWEVNQISYPSHIAPGGTGYLVLQIFNVGRQASSGPVTVTDVLPPGMIATEAGYGSPSHWNCGVGAIVTCVSNAGLGDIAPGQMTMLAIAVRAPTKINGALENDVTVSGGEAGEPSSSVEEIEDSTHAPGFGFGHVDSWFSNEDGTLDTQAGSHPYSLTVSLAFNNLGFESAGEARDITVNLPRGLIGDATVIPRCTAAQLNAAKCPADTQVGVDYPALQGPEPLAGERRAIDEYGNGFVFAPSLAVYNMVPPPGVPAQLGFELTGVGVRINAFVRSGSDYGIKAAINNIPQRELTFNVITIWGEPGDESHDYQRSQERPGSEEIEYGVHSSVGRVPFLTLPTACEGPQAFVDSTDAWPEEGIEAPISEQSSRSSGSTRLS